MRLLSALAVGMILVSGGFLWFAHENAIAEIDPPSPASFPPSQIARGEKLAALGNCAVCHTAAGGEINAGARPLRTPFGTLHSTNITPRFRHRHRPMVAGSLHARHAARR